MQHRFSLEKYRQDARGRKRVCPSCGQKSFAWYKDNQTGNYLDASVGICDRLDKCAHHYTPRQWFADTGQTEAWQGMKKLLKSPILEKSEPKKFEIVPDKLFQASFNHSFPSDFEIYLYRYFAPAEVEAACR